jgi:hypothetical protein
MVLSIVAGRIMHPILDATSPLGIDQWYPPLNGDIIWRARAATADRGTTA